MTVPGGTQRVGLHFTADSLWRCHRYFATYMRTRLCPFQLKQMALRDVLCLIIFYVLESMVSALAAGVKQSVRINSGAKTFPIPKSLYDSPGLASKI